MNKVIPLYLLTLTAFSFEAYASSGMDDSENQQVLVRQKSVISNRANEFVGYYNSFLGVQAFGALSQLQQCFDKVNFAVKFLANHPDFSNPQIMIAFIKASVQTIISKGYPYEDDSSLVENLDPICRYFIKQTAKK